MCWRLFRGTWMSCAGRLGFEGKLVGSRWASIALQVGSRWGTTELQLDDELKVG